MKKFLSLTLVLIIIISVAILPSCKKELTPFELTAASGEKLEAADGMDISIDMKMKMNMQGMSIEIPMEMEIQTSGLKSDSPTAKLTMTMSVMGATTEVSAYLKDNMYYLETAGQGFAIDPTKPNADEFLDGMTVEENLADVKIDLPEEAFPEALEVIEGENGAKIFTLKFNEDEFKKYFPEVVEAAADSSELTDVKISDAELTLTIDKDANYKSMKYDFTMTASVSAGITKVETDVDVEMTMTFNKIGDGVTVEPIEGYESFKKMN